MKFYSVLALAACAVAYDHGSTYGGSGPYKSYFFEVESLPNHTFYQPLQSGSKQKGSNLKLPVIVWVGLKFRNFLGEVSSGGALAIATGPAYVDPEEYAESLEGDTSAPTDGLGENPAALTEAIDWLYANAGRGDWKHIDRTRIGVWGQSCGGLEAYTAGAHDDRVGHLGIFNSGQLSANASKSVAGDITKPAFYILGGPTDVAYPNGNLDYANLPSKTPAWKGSHNLGHSAAFDVPNAGIPGIAGRKILQWVLRGDRSAKKWFVGDEAHQDGFVNVTSRHLDSIRVTPI
ncbi:hypothetical protein ASPCAL03146 [Aspergillus calidoustus]|uniref:Dienelactone hydrolase domain-containing protein n=1 Tax=Aspergillus calidoustus TaxID=454130 RepID=A0A0U5GPN7_ASPCI|nr:hypothetical protein ASPCAL03146 [Aspergillus calidoustus]